MTGNWKFLPFFSVQSLPLLTCHKMLFHASRLSDITDTYNFHFYLIFFVVGAALSSSVGHENSDNLYIFFVL